MTRAIVGGCGRRMALARLQLRLSQALAGHRVTLGPHSGPGWLSPMGLGCALSLVAPTRLQIVVDKQIATEAMCEAGPKATATAVPKHERAATHACWSQHAAAQSQHMDRRIGMIVQVKKGVLSVEYTQTGEHCTAHRHAAQPLKDCIGS
jgi:hypothetical protein